MEHSKLPWKYTGEGIIDADGHTVALLLYPNDSSPELAKTNGELIVKWCNRKTICHKTSTGCQHPVCPNGDFCEKPERLGLPKIPHGMVFHHNVNGDD